MKKLMLLFVLLFAGCGDPSPDPSVSSIELVYFHNRERSKQGLEDYELHDGLTKTAQRHAFWMADKRSLTHQSLRNKMGEFNAMGENIAFGQENEEVVTEDWMNSTGHRRNILNPDFTNIGFGWARDKDGRFYWCTVFGGN